MGAAKGKPLGCALRAVAASATLASILSGALAIATASAADPDAAPANYRQRVAAKLRQMVDVSTVRSPQISRPHMKFVGLLQGGTRPTVCVRLIKPNMIGSPGIYTYVFYFNNGQADGYQEVAYSFVQQALNGCPDQPLTPFTELTRSR